MHHTIRVFNATLDPLLIVSDPRTLKTTEYHGESHRKAFSMLAQVFDQPWQIVVLR